MPYIDPDIREALDPAPTFYAESPGELNYQMSMLVDEYLHRAGPPGYANYNEAIGVLECCKLEIYRRLVAVYEDQKIEENGDVFL